MIDIEQIRAQFDTFPPAKEKARLEQYERYRKLFRSGHRELYDRQLTSYEKRRYILSNFAKTISLLSADLLFGEKINVRAAPPDLKQRSVARRLTDRVSRMFRRRVFNRPVLTEQDGPQQERQQSALDNMVAANSLHRMNYRAALGQSYRGDTLLKVAWRKRHPEIASGVEEAIISEVSTSLYFPELDPDDADRVVRTALAWEKAVGGKRYLRVEQHEPGYIYNLLFVRDESVAPGERRLTQVALDTLPEYEGMDEVVETGLDYMPLFYVPNFQGESYWGISDYEGLEPFFEAINNRLTMMDTVLDKHVAPKIVMPPRFIDAEGKVDLAGLEVINLQPGEEPPSYLTWDAQLTAAEKQIDRLIDLVLLHSETSPSAFGIDRLGGVAESGRALWFRMLRTIAKINRKKMFFDAALRKALFCAQEFEAQFGKGGYTPAEPEIEWQDGIPQDLVEMIQNEATRIAAGLTSAESAIERLDGVDDAGPEMERIAAEAEGRKVLTGAPGGAGGDAFGQGDDEGDEDGQGGQG